MSLSWCTVFLEVDEGDDTRHVLVPDSFQYSPQGKDLPSCGSVWTETILRVSQKRIKHRAYAIQNHTVVCLDDKRGKTDPPVVIW